MKTNLRILILLGIASGGYLFGQPPSLAATVGLPVWEVSHFPPTSTIKDGNHVAVYGDILVLSRTRAIVMDKGDARRLIRINLDHLDPAERRRINEQCTRRTCSEIISGITFHGRIVVLSAGSFVSLNPTDSSDYVR